jgi:hypothetical protein
MGDPPEPATPGDVSPAPTPPPLPASIASDPPPEQFEHPPSPRTNTGAPDPWAHRRGEPRVFAFFWTVYVLLAVAGSILWVARFAAVSAGSYGPAARVMLIAIAIGATVLWPMVRLCQASPRGSVPAHILADVLVVLLPVQFVLWPLIILAGWPAAIVAGVAAQLFAWVAMSGGFLAIGLSGTHAEAPGDPRLLARAGWMAAILLVVGAGPLMALIYGLGHRAAPEWLSMMSPLTGIPAVTGRGLSGPEAPISAMQWRCITLIAAAAAGVWILAGLRDWLGHRPKRA